MVTYNNIQLVHVENGLDINYNLVETDKEVLFAFKDGNLINGLTHSCDIEPIKSNMEILDTKDIKYIKESSFLYYSSSYQRSFTHYMTQCLPKLNVYTEDMLLVVPKSTYNNLCKEILDLMGISRVLVLEPNTTYIFNKLHTLPHHSGEWHADLNNQHSVDVFNKLRNKLNISPSIDPKRKVYLRRDYIPNKEFNNGEVGSSRKILNEDELINTLESKGFEIITLGTKTLNDKSVLLKDVDVLITQLGANCMNLFLSNGPNKLLLLSNDKPIWDKYYVGLCSQLNGRNISHNLLTYKGDGSKGDPKNIWNNPFSVSVGDVLNYLNK